jgi:hypothetical protein
MVYIDMPFVSALVNLPSAFIQIQKMTYYNKYVQSSPNEISILIFNI